MKSNFIEISYKASEFTDEEIQEISSKLNNYGKISIQKWYSTKGHIDLYSIFSTIVEFSKEHPILVKYAYDATIGEIFKGVFHSNKLREIATNKTDTISSEIVNLIKSKYSFFKTYYEVFIVKKEITNKAISHIEQLGNLTIYIVLNHEKVNEELIENLAVSIVKIYGLLSLGIIEIESEGYQQAQLYPNFLTNTWDYLFLPTRQAYGNFIDRYYDLNDEKIYYFDNALDFLNKFPISDIDEYKFLISAKYYLKNQEE